MHKLNKFSGKKINPPYNIELTFVVTLCVLFEKGAKNIVTQCFHACFYHKMCMLLPLTNGDFTQLQLVSSLCQV